MQKKLFETLYSNWKEELGQPIFESKSLYIAEFSLDGKLLQANKTMSDLFHGNPSKSLLNPTFTKLISIHPDNSLVYKGFLTIGDQVDHFTSINATIFRKKDLILIVGSINANQLKDENQEMSMLNNQVNNLQRQLIKDKSILQSTYEQLNLANESLKEANATKDKFLSIMAHDLKNPFNVLLGFSDLLLENIHVFSKDEVLQQISIINKTTHQTYGILEDLLLWSRLQLGRIVFEPTNMNLNEICLNVVTSLSEMANKKHIQVDVVVNPDAIVQTDNFMFKTILRNLVSNAIKFSWHDSCVTISAENESQMTAISVIDHGVGIPPEKMEKIWNLSEQFSTVGTNNEEGSGLGLLLCKEFTEKQGGTISVISTLSKGSEFRFTVPKGS